MLELLSNFTVTQIILFIVLIAIAIKEIINFVDWAKDKIKKRDKENQTEIDKDKENTARLNKLEENVAQIADDVKNISGKVNILIESDKDDIKAWITQQHHYYCYQKGWIDDFSLDGLEKRYSHYVEENGNSYALDLMQEIRALPKRPADYKGAN